MGAAEMMPDVSGRRRRKELSRADRVLPGLWRLRLPLPWPGVPHVNAFAIAAGSGVVLVDTGLHEPGAMRQLERALDQAGLRLEHVRLLACTHTHSDHYGQAAPIKERAGCELWMHPNHQHATRRLEDPELALQRRLEVARTSGVPQLVLRRYAEMAKEQPAGIARIVDPDLALLPGIEIETDLGMWQVIETPGHAPSHVCLYQPERRILMSGDHLLGRISLYYDYGWTPDPVGEFLRSLDAVEALKPAPRLCLAGHARPFTDVQAHIEANRELVAQRVAATAVAIESRPLTAYEVVPLVHGDNAIHAAAWLLTETLCYLQHLEAIGAARRESDPPTHPERWVSV
jgi:glyoxylase-like metal-dependent hydrolase (beta-lactamase superfamily II)